MQALPLSLYVHLPWCVKKCPYCDFNSHTAGDDPPRGRYLDALIAELGIRAEAVAGRRLESVFLGGGTPSLFTAAEIGRLISAVRQRFDLAENAEVTLEANPGTVESGSPAGYRHAGVNRLSLGAQSFAADKLRLLGRIHSVDDIERSFHDARAAGFDNINIDLMYALPGQTVREALADVDAALALEPEHLSWYQLTIEPNTVFHARPPAGLPDHDQGVEIQDRGQALIAARGYAQYEVSAYARPGRRCRHNLNYWTFGDYVAVGAGAHAKFSNSDGIFRYANPANPLAYMQVVEAGGSPAEAAPIEAGERVFEFMLNALRLVDGFAERDFEARTGLSPEVLEVRAAQAREKGLIRRSPAGLWQPTALGQRFLNDLQTAFLP